MSAYRKTLVAVDGDSLRPSPSERVGYLAAWAAVTAATFVALAAVMSHFS